MKKILFFFLAAFAAFTSYAQSVTISQPNGGETIFGCQTYQIRWTATGVSNFWNIEYSLNNGSTWTTDATNLSVSPSGGVYNYNWTVPSVVSSVCLVRVTDFADNAKTDQSNAVFTIAQAVVVSAPNGGESWQGLTNQNITWTSPGTAGPFNIAYSSNNGTNWTNIQTNYSGNTLTWSVPNIPTTQALVRVQNASNTCQTDNSNANFIISAATPVLTAPNGGQTWTIGTIQNITWTPSTFYSNVDIEYSTNNGSTWTTIVTNDANDGAYSWTVPNAPTSQALIRISNNANPTVNDVSNAVFSIVPGSVTITQPNGGETLYACQSYQIRWTSSGTSGFWNIEYSLNNGATWTSEATNLSIGASGGVYTYGWTVPTVSSNQVLVRITDFNDNTKTDVSNAIFTISPAITVTFPNGGESLQGLTSQSITWNSPGTVGPFQLQYSVNNGTNWTNITSGITGNTYTWTVPNNPSAICLVKVINQNNTCQQDISNANFTITPATPILTAPNGGESYVVGAIQNITWNASTYYSTVNIEYSTNNGSSWTTIATGDPNDGTYPWTVPNTPTSQALVRVSNSANVAINDVSNAVFSIIPGSVTVTAPNGGEVFYSCRTTTIQWTAVGVSNFWNIDYSSNNGSTWTSVATSLSVSPSGGVYSYTWTIPFVSSAQVLVRVRDFNDLAKTDISNATFTISYPITITANNGGSTWQGNTLQNITWTAAGLISGTLYLEYSINNGSSWNFISSGEANDGSYSWTVPNTPSTQALIRMRDNTSTCQVDISDAVFTISEPTPILTAPNGGETWTVNSTRSITWNSNSFFSTVNLDYSINNGSTWIPIATGVSNTGGYSWLVPNTPSSQCLVRASNSANTAINDVSNAVFTIQMPTPLVTAPNGGEVWNVATTQNITWNSSTYVSSVRIEYSADNGVTWNLITSNTPNTGSYAWTIPSTPTAVALMRIFNTAFPTVGDTSNGVFTIANPLITVTNPTGVTQWQVNQAVTINYTTGGGVTNVRIEYSTNGGTTWNTIVTSTSNTGSYAWTVPNIPGTQNVIRVSNAANLSVNGSSPFFTVLTPMTVNLPNGGEVMTGCQSYTVQLTKTPFITTNWIQLDYSIDGGLNWVNFANPTNNGLTTQNVTFSVPNVSSNTAIIRAFFYSVPAARDSSDGFFTINPSQDITVLTPSAPVNYTPGQTVTISWSNTANVSGLYTITWRDSLGNFSSIASGISGNNYIWTVPNTPSGPNRFRVRDTNNSCREDLSDTTFRILPNSPILTYPNGGEVFDVNDNVTITWNTATYYTNLRIEYSSNNGFTWTPIVTSTSNSGAYSWTVPAILSNQYIVRVQSVSNLLLGDSSNTNFTVRRPIQILTPLATDTFTACNTIPITFRKGTNTGTIYNAFVSTDNGSTWTQVITNEAISNGAYTVSSSFTQPVDNYSGPMRLRVLTNFGGVYGDTLTYNFFVRPSNVINLVTPNGGQTFNAGTQQLIGWNNTLGLTSFQLQYSQNGGTSWSTIANSVPCCSYTWTIPNVNSNQVLVRVRDQNNACRADTSNTALTIIPTSPQLTSPNGGETWNVNSSQTITWNSATFFSTVRLAYSLDNGVNWILIANSVSNTGSYTWTPVPNAVSTQCLVRASNVSDTTWFDVSNAVFTIRQPKPVLITPNGGEVLDIASTYNITWQSNTISCTSVRLEYSTNNGFTWSVIASALTNNGIYNWTVPAVPTTQGRIRVVNECFPAQMDTSDNAFTILTPVQVLYPNMVGDSLKSCQSVTVTFRKNFNNSNTFYFYYTLDNGLNWVYVNGSSFSSTTSGSFSWTVPQVSGTAQARVKISNSSDPNNPTLYQDSSDQIFTIKMPVPDITVVNPNGGQSLNAGQSYTVSWTNGPTASGLYTLRYTSSGGNSTFASNVTGNNYIWTVPNINASNVLMRVTDQNNTCRFDTSDTYFTIIPATPQLTSPNGGEFWGAGTNQTITWSTATIYSGATVRLDYSLDSGLTWNIIVASTSNTGSYAWTVPNLQSNVALVRITTVGSATLSDASNAVFTIGYPTPILTAPNSGTFEYTEPVTISWNTASFNSSTVRLEYSVDSGTTWTLIANATTSTGSYSWSIPNITTTKFFIRVINNLNLAVWDANNTVMTINRPVRLTVLNTPTTLTGCQTFTFTVSRSPYISGSTFIQYSTNGGATWSTATSISSGGSVNQTATWTVPNISSPNTIFNAYNTNTPAYNDTADANTVIVPDYPITVTSPNTNVQLIPGQLFTISWTNTANVSGLFRLQLYNGSTFTSTLATNITGNNWIWTVPNTPGTNWKIRVLDDNANCKYDSSDVAFTILPKTPLMTSPNGGETWWAGETKTITWDNSTFYNTVRIDYSLDNGFTWINITSATANDGSESWLVPWTTPRSLVALVRVSEVANLTLNDVSNAVFTINPAVRVLTPNGGLQLGACTNSSISFEHSPQISTNGWTFRIEYSLNNGINWTTLATSQSPQTTTLTTYNYSIPNSSSTQYIARVSVAQNTSYFDISDSANTIKPAVTIIQPNFGGVLQVGSTYQIKWSSDGISNLYNLYYSTTGAAGPYTTIQLNYNTSTNQFNWTVPNTPSNNCYLIIQDATAACKTDTSNLAFIISSTSSQITVTAPNGGDTLSGCQSYNITWTDAGANGPYNVSYTTDGAATYNTIATNVNATNFSWVVPNTINSSNVLVRVQSAAAPTVFDLSNALFTIQNGRVIAGPDTTVCQGQSAQLIASGGNGIYTWTPAGTLNNSGISNPVATPSVTTTYTATSNNSGCILSDTARVVVIPGGVVTPAVNISVSPNSGVCSGASVTFTATPTNGGSSPTYQWKRNGANVGPNNSSFVTSSIANNDFFTCVMTSSASCVSPTTATSNGLSLTVFPSVTPSISISASATSVCAGTNVTFTATANNGGGAPVYQWKLNGNNVGTNSATYSNNALANNDIVVCELTSSANCATPLTVNSNAIAITVNSFVTPTIGITVPSTTVCSGQSVVFSSSITNGGATPVYQWKKNGSNVGTGLATYTTSTLANNDVITCELTSNATCANPLTVTSNSLTMNVVSSAVPSVTIVSNDTDICAGTTVNFIASAVNGGSAPSYQWKVGSTNVGTNSPSYSSNSLTNGQVVTVVMTSNFACASPTTATSSGITMVVNPTNAPTVSIVASPAGAICTGTSVTFTATANNAGSTPSYQWKLNGNNVGSNASTYSNSALLSSDIVSCVLTSSSNCASPNTATSNTITMTVNSNVVPTIAISTTNTNVCAGTNVVFTSTTTNGGSSPTYQWRRNGTVVGTNAASFSSTTLSNNDIITCRLTSNAACATPDSAVSNPITMTINAVVAPSVAIVTANTVVCAGASVTYTATPTNGGSNPAYQWKLNGNNVGTNSNTFTTTGLANNDAISVVLTSNATCASPVTATSNTLNMTVNPSVTPSVAISATATSICAGGSITFTATATNGGNLPAYQWRVNGSPSGTNSNLFTTTSLLNGDVVTCILTSNASCATTANATSNALTITVNNAVVPSVIIAGNNAICSGASVTFTATPTNGGATPTYQWKVNGVNAGTNAASFTTATLANNDVVSVAMTSAANCAVPSSATSNSITMTVTPSATPAVSISASSTNICAGTSVTFTATPTNGGGAPSYQWKVNGINAGTNLATFSSSTLNNNDLVSVVMTSNATCASPNSVTSNAIAITVNALSAPTISISTGATIVCNGANVTFNASVTNAGSSPVYQWRVNGNNVGTNLSSFSTASLVNGDVVSCQFTSSSPCAGTTTVSSNNVTMTVTPSVAPAVSISASSTNICNGASVTFTASPTNGGTTPAYQWKVNGNNVGTNSATFTTTTLSNNDVVTVVLTSNATCAVPSSATSNSLTITVGSNATPTIVINTSGTSVCAGSNVTFNANITNGGSNPAYQWKVNGNNAGTNSASFTTNSLANGAVVSCVLTSNASCVTQTTANSNNITMTVSPVVTPSTSISATATTICAGASVTFIATPTNGGSSPSYQWKVNGNNAGSNSPSFSSASLAGGDIVTCELTSSAACPSVPTATSNAITMTVNGNVTPLVSIVTSGNNICAGTSVIFTATPTNGGTTPAYQWKVNGNNAGSNAATFTSTTLANNDVVSVVLTSNASCASPVTATSNSITMVVTPGVAPTITISGSGPVCAGSNVTFTASINNGGAAPAYQWKVNGSNVGTGTSTYTSSSLANNDVVSCVLTSNANCASPVSVTSNQITAVVNANVTPSVTISTPNTTVCSGSSVTFTATPTNGGAAPAYQWKVNGNNAGTNAASFTTSTLVNGDVVTVILTSNANCLTTTTATSNSLTITTTGGAVTPAISIAASATNICAGSPVTFTATPVNGGPSPVYQWKVNGIGTGTNSATFVTSGLSNNDVVSCTLTSNAACASPTTANSNTITITVTSALQPAVSISTTTPSICTGTPVAFTATATNAGTTPSYQWKVNGVNVGANASTYTSSSFNNSDVVVCVVTASSQCANGVTVTSNSVTVSVSAVVTPSVSIATPSTTVCSGSNVVFTATATNGGSSPAYQWKVNGSNAGSNSSLFSSTSLSFGDVVTCILTSNAACATVANVTSNSITMNVSTSVTPTISVSATPGTSVCAGTPVTFLATATNGGSSPVYQWKVNGVNQGTNAASFNATGLNNGDAITCFFTSSETCASPATVTSTPIGMVVTPIPSAPVATANSPVCEGSVLQLNAPTVSGATYSWSGPNAFVATIEDPAIANPTAANSGTYSLVVSVNGCNSAPGTVSVVVNAKPTTPVVTQSGNVLTSSAAVGNQWYLNNNFIANANNQSYTASQQGWYVVVVTGANGCSSSSDSLFVTPVGVVDLEFAKLLNVYPNPVADNLNLEISGSVNSTEKWTYSLTDVAGRVIDFNHISSLQTHIGMADKAAGVYFVNITDGNRHTTFKVLKQE